MTGSMRKRKERFETQSPAAQLAKALVFDPFLNYILIYAYSNESGTDQCDCGIIKDTAMASRFAGTNPQCGHSDNRCLYYGGGCDTNSSGNIALAEMRAPFPPAE